MKKRIVQLVLKNTSTLDFTIPIFQRLSLDDRYECTVIFWGWDEREFLRSGSCYKRYLNEYGVNIKCLSDFIPTWIGRLLRSGGTRADRLSFLEIRRLALVDPLSVVLSVYKYVSYSIKNIIGAIFLRPEAVVSSKIDCLLYDLRKNERYFQSKILKEYLKGSGLPIYFIPHAPHMRTPDGDFVDFFDGLENFPKCNYAVCHKFAKPKHIEGNTPLNYFLSGYPGFDNDWLDILKKKDKLCQKKKKILYIGRRFVHPDVKIEGFDIYTQSFDLANSNLGLIVSAVGNLDAAQIIYKPHPNVNNSLISSLISKYSSVDISVSYEPIFEVLKDVDYVISEPSTVVLISGIMNIPTAIFDGALQAEVEKSWVELKWLYEPFEKVKNIKDLNKFINRHESFHFERSRVAENRIRDMFPSNAAYKFLMEMDNEK